MTVNILKAISKMLEDNRPDTLKTRVECAKIMLDEVIKGMCQCPEFEPTIVQSPRIEQKEEPKLKPHPKDKPYKVVVNAAGKITKIDGLDPEANVILDGKIMKHKDALGKTFKKVELP